VFRAYTHPTVYSSTFFYQYFDSIFYCRFALIPLRVAKMAQNQGQGSLFESYEASYCAAATSVSNSLAALTALPLGMCGA
jgi:hypothetical protein